MRSILRGLGVWAGFNCQGRLLLEDRQNILSQEALTEGSSKDLSGLCRDRIPLQGTTLSKTVQKMPRAPETSPVALCPEFCIPPTVSPEHFRQNPSRNALSSLSPIVAKKPTHLQFSRRHQTCVKAWRKPVKSISKSFQKSFPPPHRHKRSPQDSLGPRAATSQSQLQGAYPGTWV